MYLMGHYTCYCSKIMSIMKYTQYKILFYLLLYFGHTMKQHKIPKNFTT